MYKVLIAFCDGEKGRPFPPSRGGVAYQVGDDYPRAGFTPSAEHIKYLLGKSNKFGKPLIEEVKPEVKEEVKPEK